MEESYGFRSARNFVPHEFDLDVGLLVDLKSRGHEIGIQGYKHEGRFFESARTFQRRTSPINQALHDHELIGFRAPMVHRYITWMQALDIEYDGGMCPIDFAS